MSEPFDCLIVGAGMAGLLAAQALHARGMRTVVLEAGPSVGGRLATRRIDGVTYDAGAQFFTTRDDRFQALVEMWQKQGVVSEWCRGFATVEGPPTSEGFPRYRSTGGMAALAAHLATGLDVRTNRTVTDVRRGAGHWMLTGVTGDHWRAAALILTPPVPVSLALLAAGGTVLPYASRQALAAIDYDRCLTLLVELAGPSRVPAPGGMQLEGEPIPWLADNQIKGISPAPGLTVHATPAFSRAHWQTGNETIARQLLAAADPWLGAAVVRTEVQRWPHSKPLGVYQAPCLPAIEDPPLLFAGDAFAGPRVEGAALSGLAAADWLLNHGHP